MKGKRKMENKKGMIRYFIIIFVIIIVVSILLRGVSYHEENNYSEIESILYSKFVEYPMDKKLVLADDIKRIENKIRRINLYHTKETSLQESPTSIMTIIYKDGTKKSFDIAGNYVLVTTANSNGEFEPDKSKLYYVSLFDIWLLEKYIF